MRAAAAAVQGIAAAVVGVPGSPALLRGRAGRPAAAAAAGRRCGCRCHARRRLLPRAARPGTRSGGRARGGRCGSVTGEARAPDAASLRRKRVGRRRLMRAAGGSRRPCRRCAAAVPFAGARRLTGLLPLDSPAAQRGSRTRLSGRGSAAWRRGAGCAGRGWLTGGLGGLLGRAERRAACRSCLGSQALHEYLYCLVPQHRALHKASRHMLSSACDRTRMR